MKYRTYTQEQIEKVKALFENGKNKCEISRIMDIPRGTITQWIHPRYKKKTDKPRKSYVPITDFDEYLNTPEKRAAYSFILAIYLCDGHISRYKTYRAPSIKMSNDCKYPLNTEEWGDNLKILFPENSVNIYKYPQSNCNIVLLYSRKLLDLFPQYGDGVKHKRKLTFSEWQRRIIQEYPEQFIRGCIQSDGCIYNQKVGKYAYKRYNFTNMSEDIVDLFLETLQLIGIKKEKWQDKRLKKFTVQNFSKDATKILSQIIDKKE